MSSNNPYADSGVVSDSDDDLPPLVDEDGDVYDDSPQLIGSSADDRKTEDDSEGDETPPVGMATTEAEASEDARAAKLRGNTHYKSGDYKAAVAAYSEALALEPMIAPWYGNRAAANMMLEHFDEAIVDCEKAVELDPEYIKGYMRMSTALLSQGRFNEASSTVTRALVRLKRHEKEYAAAQEMKAKIGKTQRTVEAADAAIKAGNWNRAHALCTSATREAPAHFPLRLMLIQCLIGKRDYDTAYALTTDQLPLHPRNSKLLHLRARCLYQQGSFPSAIKHLQEALRCDPDNNACAKDIRMIRKLEKGKQEGNAAFKARRWTDAIKAYTDCLALDPTNFAYNAKLHCNRAAALMKLNRNEEAIADCTKTVELDPMFAKGYMRRAMALSAIGGKENLQRALQDFNKAKEVLPPSQKDTMESHIRKTMAALKQASRKDYYKILGVPRNAAPEAIRKAYKKAALRCHPDRHSGKTAEQIKEMEHKFKDVGEAYAVLNDEQKRARYDQGVDIEHLDDPHGGMGGGMGGMGGMGGIDPNILFSMFGGGMGGMGGGMGGMGGGMGGGRRSRRRHGGGGAGFHFG